eukprot:2647786-Rhodomonas_salina.2
MLLRCLVAALCGAVSLAVLSPARFAGVITLAARATNPMLAVPAPGPLPSPSPASLLPPPSSLLHTQRTNSGAQPEEGRSERMVLSDARY